MSESTSEANAPNADLTQGTINEFNHGDTMNNCLDYISFDGLDEGIPDEKDVYNRFYFESDHLALKDNTDYQQLLQTLVALEAQRKQAVFDYEKLIKLRKEAVAEPIKFVEKLQNNESLDIPSRQNIVKIPQINWETYAGNIDDISQLTLLHQHNTRNANLQSLERNNHRWEEQSTTSNGSMPESLQDNFRLSCNLDHYVRGKLATNDKPMTFNQPWSGEEQRKLERLLQVYPQEDIESKRWSKIANALGNRTPKQVASRVQKYFIKLAKAGLPVPGRLPNMSKLLTKLPRNNVQQQVVSFRDSTFFPSYQPHVYMEDNLDENNDQQYTVDEISDDETIPEVLRNTQEYKELLEIKRLKRKRNSKKMKSNGVVHYGFMCDVCGMNPILGVRWHCLDCPIEASTDLCVNCVEKKEETDIHFSSHKLEPIDWMTGGDFVDDDYLKLGKTSKGYNYLDPNFLPDAN